MPITIHYPDGTVKRIEGKPRKLRPGFIGPPKPYPWPPKPKEPTWPQYSDSKKYRVVKEDGKYAIQKKGWFWWSIITICTGEIWFWPTYGPAIYKDWEAAMNRMEWESTYGR